MNRDDLFISDLHLDSTTAERQAFLLRMLERHGLRARRLMILGDLFNVWTGRKQLGEPYVVEVVDALARLADNGVEVHFVAGNRDFYGLRALAARTGMITHAHGFPIESFGQRVWICHGHELFTRDRRTRQAQAVTHSWPVEMMFAYVLPKRLGLFLGHGYTNHSKRVVHHKSGRMLTVPDEALARLFAAGNEVIVCGHTHQLSHQECRRDGRRVGDLYHLGAWDQGPHFLRHGPDGWHFHELAI